MNVNPVTFFIDSLGFIISVSFPMIVGPTILPRKNKTSVFFSHFSSDKMSSFTIHRSIQDRFYLSRRILIKRNLTEIFYKYCFLIGKKYFKISEDSRLKYSEYTHRNYSYVNML